MKVIDLLVRIAKGDKDLKDKNEIMINTYLHTHYIPECLNDEVEIIEEQKEETKTTTRESIEALGYACGEIQKCFTNGWEKSLKNKSLNKEDKKIETIDPIDYCHSTDTSKDMVLVEKINEIIDYIMEDKHE